MQHSKSDSFRSKNSTAITSRLCQGASVLSVLILALSGCATSASDATDGLGDSLEVGECFSPTQNIDKAYESGAKGCACKAEPGQCVTDSTGRQVALICGDGQWYAVNDGPCLPEHWPTPITEPATTPTEPVTTPTEPPISPTIDEGVYGIVTTYNDVGPNLYVSQVADFPIEVFTTAPPNTPGDGLVPLAAARTNAQGLYEIALSPGKYWICTAFRRCVDIEVQLGEVLRKDYEYGIAGVSGW